MSATLGDHESAGAVFRSGRIYTLARVFEANLPNLLTVLRILLVPLLVAFLLAEGPDSDVFAAGVFCFACATDMIDGWLARRSGAETAFGKLMDPLADKVLVTAALVALVELERLGAWVAMVIIAREFAVTGLRTLAAEQGDVVGASYFGKVKTILQMLMILLLILVDPSPAWLDALVYATVAVTIASGIDYYRQIGAAHAPPSSQSRIAR